MGTTVFAADYTITVNNALKDETYSAYRMFDLSVDNPEEPTAFRYTVNSDWNGFTSNAAFVAAFTVDAQGYVTAKSGVNSESNWVAGSVMSVLAEAAAKYAKDNTITAKASVKADADGSVVLPLTEAGYYVVSSTLGSRAMIETTPAKPGATVNEKNEQDTIDKKVQEDSTNAWGTENDAQVGDTVNFKSEATIAARSINVKIHDKMDSGLTLNANSIKVYTDEACTITYNSATIKTGNNAASGDTFTIEIPDSFAATATTSQKLYITYTAEINSNAVVKDASGVAIVDQNNKTHVTFGDGTSSTEKTTTTTTHNFAVFKHAKNSNNQLADAIFTLKKNGEVVNLIKLNANNYRVVDDTETGSASSHVNNGAVATIAEGTIVSDFVTVSSGNIIIWGVDSDSDYSITELQAPKGYNKLTDPVAITVSADNSYIADVENNSGTELPSTGGMGTTIFYIIGVILLAGAAIVLVTRRRMNAE